jgi:hypothetical protein
MKYKTVIENYADAILRLTTGSDLRLVGIRVSYSRDPELESHSRRFVILIEVTLPGVFILIEKGRPGEWFHD